MLSLILKHSVSFEFRKTDRESVCPPVIVCLLPSLQQHLSTSEKPSTNMVDDDASSCDDDESGSEDHQRENLPLVIVKSRWCVHRVVGRLDRLSSLESTKEQENRKIASARETASAIDTSPKSLVPRRKRRVRITERPNQRYFVPVSRSRDDCSLFSVNLWNIIKNCVGKDLSKIPIPVNFSEPLSMLQRVTEELEYSSVLDMAAKAEDSWEQLAYVAAFTISSYSTTATRVNKPFNPLLGETFECDRTDDFNWRAMSGENESDIAGVKGTND